MSFSGFFYPYFAKRKKPGTAHGQPKLRSMGWFMMIPWFDGAGPTTFCTAGPLLAVEQPTDGHAKGTAGVDGARWLEASG